MNEAEATFELIDEARSEFVEAIGELVLKEKLSPPQGLADGAAWERYEKTCRDCRRKAILVVKQVIVDVMDLVEQTEEEDALVEANRAIERWLEANP